MASIHEISPNKGSYLVPLKTHDTTLSRGQSQTYSIVDHVRGLG